MSDMPPVTLSTTDRDRIDALLERLSQEGARESEEVADLLYRELDRANVVAPEALPSDVVSLGSRVSFENEDTGKVHTLQLVMPQEMDGSAERISLLTPAGAALIGLTVGARIKWPAPGRELHLKLIAVER